MDPHALLAPLNPAQREAVTCPERAVLVLAGAGSGKTRVLVHRIAWLVRELDRAPGSILAVTFTNKAAAEMRGRCASLLGGPARGLWVGTFHGIAHRLLRSHWEQAGLPQTFQILDADDQKRLLKRVITGMGLDEKRWPAQQAQWWINTHKDEGRRAADIELAEGSVERIWRDIYAEYETQCNRAGLVDFAELLLRSHELWLQRPDLLEHYQTRFQCLLVDEFQDTNAIQYAWLRVLAGQRGEIFVVGDDDQSIYGWRGARVENVLHFGSDFPGAQVLRLEQNYRSTGVILDAANALIACNPQRLGKRLWTAGQRGNPIRVVAAYDEIDEAQHVVEQIRQWIASGQPAAECAILYRSNAQSRVFEEALSMQSIPYRVYGGLRFFERAEIKDALAYLRLIANPGDDAAFERAVNTPPRGIGERTVEQLRGHARTQRLPLWDASRELIAAGRLAARSAAALAQFIALIQRLARDGAGWRLHERIEALLEVSGLREHHQRDARGDGEARAENLDELVNVARRFVLSAEDEDAGLDELSAFLSHAALEAGEGQADPGQDCVQLMTLHAAKGLEFAQVFLVGMEDGLFPTQRAIDDPQRLQEERRLAYVGITRARQRLSLSWAERRRLRGGETWNLPSRFLGELPPELIEQARPKAAPAPSMFRPAPVRLQGGPGAGPALPFRLGQNVRHPRFGEGVVLALEGSGEHARIQVQFAESGAKWLVLAYARLEAA